MGYMWGMRGTVEETNDFCEGISANGAYHQNQRDWHCVVEDSGMGLPPPIPSPPP